MSRSDVKIIVGGGLPNISYQRQPKISSYETFDVNVTEKDEKTPSYGDKLKKAFQSKPARYTGYFFNGVYTFMVSALFAAFAYRRAKESDVVCIAISNGHGRINVPLGLFYAFASFAMNAPMAWIFTEGTIEAGKRVFKKKEYAFKAAFGVGVFLALFTTVAGVKVARESVNGLEQIPFTAWVFSVPGLKEVLTTMSAANTFMTRFVGSAYLLFAAWQFTKSFVRRRQVKFAAHYQFLDDLERYGDEVDVKINLIGSDTENLKRYAEQFYTAMCNKEIHPGSSWKHTLIDTAVFTGTVVLGLALILNMMPLWIKLTVGGAASMSRSLSHSTIFVLTAAASNELFYFYSCRLFIPRAITLAKQGYANAKAKFAESSRVMIAGVIGLAFLGVATWATLAYFSGTGYGEDGVEAVKCGFGKLADSLWFSWMGWYTNGFLSVYPNLVATVSAGTIVNGGAFLSFAQSRLSCFRKAPEGETEFGPQRARTTLKKTIEAGHFDGSLNDSFQFRRRSATPHKTILESCSSMWRRCRGASDEEMPLNPHDSSKFIMYEV